MASICLLFQHNTVYKKKIEILQLQFLQNVNNIESKASLSQ